jgi:cytochrome c biogenesis protein CcmG/thiol:disulfide interchange protein DsbE
MLADDQKNENVKEKKRLPQGVKVLVVIGLLAFLGMMGWALQDSQRGSIGIGQQVPEFTLTTFEGEQIRSTDLLGKVVVLNFWASWCTPCEQEAAELQKAWEYFESNSNVVFLGVDYVDTDKEASAYLAKFQITYPNGPDLGTKISQMFRISGVPETYIIRKDGKLAYVKIGPFANLDEITSAVNAQLEK